MHLGPGTFIPDPPKADSGCLMPALGMLVLFAVIIAGIEQCSKKLFSSSSQPEPERGRLSTPPPPPPPPPQKTMHFLALGPRTLPTPVPAPVLLGRRPNGDYVFGWRGKDWFLPPPPNRPYRYLCVTNGLSWCWQSPPRPFARACTRKSDGERGWCWEE